MRGEAYAARKEKMYRYVRTLFLHKTCPMHTLTKNNPGPGVLDSVEMIGRTLG